MKKYIFSIFTLCFAVLLQAQNSNQVHKCGETQMVEFLDTKYPGYKAFKDASFEMIKGNPKYKAEASRGNKLTVPVVFHVIYNNDEQNIADSLILNQLQIINNAFNHSHSDIDDIRDIFKPVVGNANIEFVLASEDPEGNPTTGITRTKTDIPYFGDLGVIFGTGFESIERIKYTDKGGFDGWPGNRYINIWIADMAIDFLGQKMTALLGIATPPLYPQLPDNWPPEFAEELKQLKDGVIIQYQTVGQDNPYAGDIDNLALYGRTAVHEIGHYFGLRHISGDADDCSGTDGIDDTPNMSLSQPQGGCPSADKNTCEAAAPNDLPDMYENYMDYSFDGCQRMFTQGQIEHMRAVILAQRDTLLLNAKPNVAVQSLEIYPNPTQDVITVPNGLEGSQAIITDILGNRLPAIKIEANQPISVGHLPSGVYFLNVRKNDIQYVGKFIVTEK